MLTLVLGIWMLDTAAVAAEPDGDGEDLPARVKTMAAQMRQLFHEVRDECPTWPEWKFANYDGPRIEWPDYWKNRGKAKKK